MAHQLLVRAAQLIEQARALNDEYKDKSTMPAEVATRIDKLLTEAQNCKRQVERESQISEFDNYLEHPEHTHQPGYGGGDDRVANSIAAGPNAVNRLPGEYLTPQERSRDHKKAFFQFVRHGMSPDVRNSDLVEDASGELLVPEDFTGSIVKDLPNQAVMRSIAFVQPTSSNRSAVGVVNVNQAGWGKLETGASATDGLGGAPTKDEIYVEDLLALVKIGVDELADADDDLESVIRAALLPIIAEQEDQGFAAGTGHANEQPEGFGVDASITQNYTGVASTIGTIDDTDDLKNTVYAVPQAARAMGVFVGSSDAEKSVALLKDDFGRYQLQPNTAAGEPPTLFGYRWYTNDGLPAVEADSKSVFFGDFRRGYRIVDRQRMTVQRLTELYAEDGKIGLIFKERVGGGVYNANALASHTTRSI